jgi:hypothetical protein
MNLNMNAGARRSVAKLLMASLACLVLASATQAYAQSSGGGATNQLSNEIGLSGNDQSANLGAVNDLGSTVVSFILNVVAKVIGVAIAIWGITDFVKREVMWGTVKLFLCGACFFLHKIVYAMWQIGSSSAG